MAATRLIFVRHGESVHSVEGFLGGPRSCRGLTERGHEQAKRIADRLGAELAGPVAVYSSVLRRAVETAAPIAAALGTEPRQDCGLCTWHPPEYADGMPTTEYQRAHATGNGGIFRPFEHDAEAWGELVIRVGRSVLEIAERHRGATAVLVCHSETIQASFRALGHTPLLMQYDLAVAPASVTEWRTDGDPAAWPQPRWTLVGFATMAS